MDRAKAMMCAEIGCGHGHSTRYFREMCGASWVGYDVSEAAVLKAEQLHRGVGHLEFRHGDLLIPPPEPIPDPVQFDIVLWGEVFWYLLHDIEHAVDHTTQLVAPGGLFVLSQGFLLGEQRYGAEIAHGWHGALELLLHSFRGFDLVFATHDPTGSHVLNHGLAMFRKRLP
jgi:SAM-dependent methyltransferase